MKTIATLFGVLIIAGAAPSAKAMVYDGPLRHANPAPDLGRNHLLRCHANHTC